jgi:hypothetical protein
MFKIKYEFLKKLREENGRICTATSPFDQRIGVKTEENSSLCGVIYRSLESVDKLVSFLSTEDGTGITPQIWSCESFIMYQSTPQSHSALCLPSVTEIKAEEKGRETEYSQLDSQ